jgi:hypothetical protein
MEIQRNIEASQQSLLTKVEVIQDHSQIIDQAVNNISLREREANVAQGTF